MSTQEIAQYWAEKNREYLSRYDRLAEALYTFVESDDYDQETTRLLEDLIDLCAEKSAHTKNKDAWHKAMSAVYSYDRA